MGTIDDIRKLLQDLVTPDLKAIRAEMAGDREATKLRMDALDAKFAARLDLVLARMDAQHSTVMNSLALDKRVENIERQIKASEPASV